MIGEGELVDQVDDKIALSGFAKRFTRRGAVDAQQFIGAFDMLMMTSHYDVLSYVMLGNPAIKLVAVGNSRAEFFGRDGMPAASDNLVLPGRLSDADVAGLMGAARAFIFPSIYEGFGIPPLEAMSNGCPALASTAEAVMKVCADAAGYFEPHDDAELARLMRQLLVEDATSRRARVTRHNARVACYRWEDSARVLLDVCGSL